MPDTNDTIIEIERLGHHGDGIAKGPIYVARTLPGEVISGTVNDGRVEQPRIVQPSPDRVKAPCPHYNTCGGCALLHAKDEFVASWKRGVVETALSAHGLTAEISGIHTSPERSRRRAVLSARRGKKGAVVGFHGRKSGVISDIMHCKLLHPDITKALPSFGELAKLGGSRKGELSITVVQSPAGLDVSVTGGKPLERELEAELGQALHSFGFARLAWNDEVIATEAPPYQAFGTAQVIPPAGSFLQATREGEAALVAAVQGITAGATMICDLFAGCGTFSLPLASHADVHAVEGERAMLDALELGWRKANGLRNVTTECRDLFRDPIHSTDLKRYDAIVIDPPRAGAEAQITEIAQSDVSTVAMVSCNPNSFARDANVLIEAGFVMTPLQVVDQFRWSTHVEMVAGFVRA